MARNVYDTSVATYTRDYLQPAIAGEEFVLMHAKCAANLTVAKGTPMAEKSDTPGLFAVAGTSGYGNACAVALYAFTTNANGDAIIENEKKVDIQPDRTVELVFGGYVRAQDIPSLDATIAGQLGKLVRGTVTNGVVHII